MQPLSSEQEVQRMLAELRAQVQIGAQFETMQRNGTLGYLEEHIFKPLDQGAFELFKMTPAGETVSVIEAQMMGKMIDKIRGRIQALIDDGKMAATEIRMQEEDALDGQEKRGTSRN